MSCDQREASMGAVTAVTVILRRASGRHRKCRVARTAVRRERARFGLRRHRTGCSAKPAERRRENDPMIPQSAGWLRTRSISWEEAASEPDTSSEPRQLMDLEEYGCDGSVCPIDDCLLEDPSGEFASIDPAEVLRYSDVTYGAIEIEAASGEIRTKTIRRSELLRELSLRPRDVRAVVLQPLPGSDAGPVLACRRATMLLGFGTVRAIVLPTRALLFGQETSERARFLRVLANQRRASSEVGFMMNFADSALLALQRNLDARLLEIRTVAEPILGSPPVLQEPTLEEVRQQRRRLLRCANQATAVSSAVMARLDGGEAAALAEADGASIEEWEAMLEVYLQAYTELSRECARLLGDIEDFEGSASLALQARRLRVEQFELSLVIASVSVGAGALLPGILGMNLLNGYETSTWAFQAAVAGSLSVSIMVFTSLRFLANQQGF